LLIEGQTRRVHPPAPSGSTRDHVALLIGVWVGGVRPGGLVRDALDIPAVEFRGPDAGGPVGLLAGASGEFLGSAGQAGCETMKLLSRFPTLIVGILDTFLVFLGQIRSQASGANIFHILMPLILSSLRHIFKTASKT